MYNLSRVTLGADWDLAEAMTGADKRELDEEEVEDVVSMAEDEDDDKDDEDDEDDKDPSCW